MDIFVGLPWWMALFLGILCVPVIVAYWIFKIVVEIVDEGIRNAQNEAALRDTRRGR